MEEKITLLETILKQKREELLRKNNISDSLIAIQEVLNITIDLREGFHLNDLAPVIEEKLYKAESDKDIEKLAETISEVILSESTWEKIQEDIIIDLS